MKVLKSGNWKEPWSGNFTCSVCKAELFVEETDLIAYDNQSDFNQYKCPECFKFNIIIKDILPLRLLEELNRKRKYYSSSGGKD